ncbi:MAG: phosphoribosylaminoimidazolesuccinocarboxamide synthase, partial [Myxococcota bacterium]
MARGEAPRSLDKEYVRRWLADEAGFTGDGPPPTLPDEVRLEAARRYIATYQLITGRAFEPDTDPPQSRLVRNLGLS